MRTLMTGVAIMFLIACGGADEADEADECADAQEQADGDGDPDAGAIDASLPQTPRYCVDQCPASYYCYAPDCWCSGPPPTSCLGPCEIVCHGTEPTEIDKDLWACDVGSGWLTCSP